MKSLYLIKRTLAIFVFLITLQVTYAQNQSFKEGDIVEVKYNGNWYEGTYISNIGEKYSNMKTTPHRVSYKSKFSSGTVNVSPNDIRNYTGTLKPKYTEAVAASSVNTNTLENEVITEINYMRSNPKRYAAKLSELKNKYVKVDGKYWYLDMLEAGGIYITDNDSERDAHERTLDEVIAELNQTEVLSHLTKNEKLRISSNILASDAGKINGPMHLDSKGRNPQERAKIAGYTGGVAENLFTGVSAFGLVGGYLIDYNVPSRGHRKSLMNSRVTEIGVACHYFPNEDYIRNVIQLGYGQTNNSNTNSNSTTTISSGASTNTTTTSTTITRNNESGFNDGFYRITNQWQGEGKSLDIVNDGNKNQPILAKTANYSGQMWRIKKVGDDTYTLSTEWQGPTKILDCVSGENQNRPILNKETGYSGGAWKITAAGNGYYKITNLWLSDKSLDVINDGQNNKIQISKTGNYSGQLWKITEF